MTEGEVLEVIVEHCKELGTTDRMRTDVLSHISKRLASQPGMTPDKVKECCHDPEVMMQYF